MENFKFKIWIKFIQIKFTINDLYENENFIELRNDLEYFLNGLWNANINGGSSFNQS